MSCDTGKRSPLSRARHRKELARRARPQPRPPGWMPLWGEGGVVPRSPNAAVRSDQLILGGGQKNIDWKHMANHAAGYLGFLGLKLAADGRTRQLSFSSARWLCFPPEELGSSGCRFPQTPSCCGPVKPQKLSFHKYHVLFLPG